jgi:serine/threonine protein kinase
MTKDPETEEFMMVIEFASKGSLSNILSNDFNNLLWKDKIKMLYHLTMDFKVLHKLRYFHQDFHSGNILKKSDDSTYISDFGLSGPANKQKSDDKIYGVLPYIAPEVLNREPYTLSSDVYSFGIIMTELSSGKPPFYYKKHDLNLALDICNGLRPEFGEGTPEVYKKLAYKCMNANPEQRPTVGELYDVLGFWYDSLESYQNKVIFGYKGKEIKLIFKKADKEIRNISTSYEKDADAIYTSRAFTFSDLPKPVNSTIITSYLNDDEGTVSRLCINFLKYFYNC